MRDRDDKTRFCEKVVQKTRRDGQIYSKQIWKTMIQERIFSFDMNDYLNYLLNVFF